MQQAARVDEGERAQRLHGDALDARQREEGLVVVVGEVLAEFVEVVLEQLRDDEEVLLVVEVLAQPQDVVRVRVALRVDVAQQLDLVERLVQEVLGVLDDLEAHVVARDEVRARERAREGRRPNVVDNAVAARDDAAHGRLELLVLLEARAPGLVHNAQREGLVPHALRRGGGGGW